MFNLGPWRFFRFCEVSLCAALQLLLARLSCVTARFISPTLTTGSPRLTTFESDNGTENKRLMALFHSYDLCSVLVVT